MCLFIYRFTKDELKTTTVNNKHCDCEKIYEQIEKEVNVQPFLDFSSYITYVAIALTKVTQKRNVTQKPFSRNKKINKSQTKRTIKKRTKTITSISMFILIFLLESRERKTNCV